MEEMQAKEKGFSDLKKACKKVLSQEELDSVEKYCFNYVLRRMRKPTDKYPISNSYMISLHKVLPKQKFDQIQFEWTADLIRNYEKQIFSDSILEVMVNYHNIIKGVEIKVEPDGLGAKITMENGCMYAMFCEETGNRTCLRGKAIEELLTYWGVQPFFCALERPPKSHTCIILAKPSLEAGDFVRDYSLRNKQITIL